MQNTRHIESTNKIYLRFYKLPRMISPYVDLLQRTVCKWNHCSIRVNDVLIHFFDDYELPRWLTPAVDQRLYKISDEIFVDETNVSLKDIREFTNKLPKFSRFNTVSRHLWYYSLGLWPKRNDCVDKCSATLTYLFNTPRCYTTPDKLIEIVDDYKKHRIR